MTVSRPRSLSPLHTASCPRSRTHGRAPRFEPRWDPRSRSHRAAGSRHSWRAAPGIFAPPSTSRAKKCSTRRSVISMAMHPRHRPRPWEIPASGLLGTAMARSDRRQLATEITPRSILLVDLAATARSRRRGMLRQAHRLWLPRARRWILRPRVDLRTEGFRSPW